MPQSDMHNYQARSPDGIKTEDASEWESATLGNELVQELEQLINNDKESVVVVGAEDFG